jgi:hypothetical protein
MAYKIAGHRREPQCLTSADDLKRAFEIAVCEIHKAGRTAERTLQHHAPIVPRGRVLGLSRADTEKRALSDAARALAQLWKV